MTTGHAAPPNAAPTSARPRLLLALVIAVAVLGSLTACGKRPGDVLPPESVQGNDPFPRSYPNS